MNEPAGVGTLIDGIQLTNQEQALSTLRALSADLQQKGVRTALRASGKPIADAMKAAAPNDPMTPGSRLASAINITIAKPGRKVRTSAGDRVIRRESDEIALLIGPNKPVALNSGFVGPVANKKKAFGPVGYIAWFTEEGTQPHDITLKKGRKVFHFGAASDRGFVRRKTVRHLGTRALNWQTKAMNSGRPQMESLF